LPHPDIDAVLTGVAELIASHDDHLESHVRGPNPDPAAQLDSLARTAERRDGTDGTRAMPR